MSKKDKSHVLVKKDCGWHFGKTGGPCEKCKDKATSMAAQRRLMWNRRGLGQYYPNKPPSALNPYVVTTYDDGARPALRNSFDTNDL